MTIFLRLELTGNQVFARKIIRVFGDVEEEDIQNEVRAVAKLCKPDTHKNIVSVFRYGSFSDSYYFLDMELCDLNLECWIERKWNKEIEKELHYLTGDFPSRMRIGQVWDVMEDVTRALAFIHSKKEIHRDLKPRNSRLSPPKISAEIISSLLS